MHATRIGGIPGYVPGMLLDRLQRAALVGTNRVFLTDISGLVDRSVPLVVEAPPVARPLELVVGVRLRAIVRDALQNLGRLISAGEHIVKGIVIGRLHRPSESKQNPPEIAGDI